MTESGHIYTLYLLNSCHCIMGYCIIKGFFLVMNPNDKKKIQNKMWMWCFSLTMVMMISVPLHTDLKQKTTRLRFQQLQARRSAANISGKNAAMWTLHTMQTPDGYFLYWNSLWWNILQYLLTLFSVKSKASVVGWYDCESLCACRKKTNSPRHKTGTTRKGRGRGRQWISVFN